MGARRRIAVDPRARAYAQARRHSARVRFYKRVIPIGTAAAVAILIGFTLAAPSARIPGLTLGPISFSGTKVTMESPRLTGYQKDNRAYEVTATSATQDVRKPNVVELTDMKGRLTLDDNGTMARLQAATGVFDTQREYLELRQDIRVTTDSGLDARLTSASIDLKGGTVASREPVFVTLPNGSVEAQALDITERGKVLTFTGRVRTVLEGTPSTQAAGEAASLETVVQPARTAVAEPPQAGLRP
jgi:lipopolysaccharide export system protein LptC